MKEKDLDRNTIVAYHSYLQNRIHNELNGVGLGPAWLPCRAAVILALLSLASLVTGILVITLRHRHVYLVDWWHAFLGPFFIILGLILATIATYLIVTAKRRSNEYRRELFFRPIGDYGVAVVHKSTLIHEEEHRSDLKSGTNPHRTVMPRAEAFSSHHGERKHRYGHENHGYNDNGHEERRHHDRRHDGERRRRDDRDRDDRRRYDNRDRDDRRRYDDRDRDDRRRRDDRDRDDRRRRDDRERRRPPDDRRYDDRRRHEERERGEPEKRRPPPDDEKREPEKQRPDDSEKERAPSQGGRRAARGIPKIAVTESSRDRVVLDEDFGKPAGYTDESEL